MAAYPVVFDVARPEKFDRAQVWVRLAVMIVLAVLQIAGVVFGAAYLVLPVLAAVLIGQNGSARYRDETSRTVTKWIGYLVAFYAWVVMLTDRIHTEDSPVAGYRFEVRPTGEPRIGNALLRIILAIPSAIVLAILWILGGLLAFIAAIMVLVQEQYPQGIHGFLLGLMRWEARLLAYMASLVGEYPPFALDTGHEAAGGEQAPGGLGATH
ncbi:MAG TPA: DUF4389 domain-containing protein [Dehalococcoidia bacterium]|nr:DUF4389 domain-containing protein [Dehalococcoidia bacterium]